MSRSARRRPAVGAGAAALVAALALSGCSQAPDGRYYPDDVDVTRARAVWTDPWAAPTQTSTAGSYAITGSVRREVGKREGFLSGDRDPILRAQVDSARTHGWRLVAASCKDSGDVGSLTLAKGERADPDGQARATFLIWTPGTTDEGEPEATPDGETLWGFSLEVSVPHHLEDAWPDPPAVELASACPSDVDSEVELPASGLSAEDRPGNREVPEESTAASPAAVQHRADLANADPLSRALGLELVSDRLPENPPTQAIKSPAAQRTLPPSTVLADVVSEATGEGWTLTYTRCGSGQVVAELRKPLSDTETATVRLTQEPDPERDGALGVLARAAATSTALAGPPPEGESVGSPCWSAPPTEGITTQGVPWFGPTELQRIRSPR